MSNDSYDSSEFSSLVDKDGSGHKLAHYLMAKNRGLNIQRIFGEFPYRRISVRVEVTKPTENEKVTNVENNIENFKKATESLPNVPREQSSSPMRANYLDENMPPSPNMVQPNTVVNTVSNAAKIPNQGAPLTPSALPHRKTLPQTPKSSQLRSRISSSDRYRRLSFKHLIGGSAKRVLLNDLNATGSSSALSEFEPGLQKLPGCTSTPATSAHLQKDVNDVLESLSSALNKTNREYQIQKGHLEGQIVLTPSHIALYRKNTDNTTINSAISRTFVKHKDQTPALSYSAQKGPVEGQIILIPSHTAAFQSPKNTRHKSTSLQQNEQIEECTVENVSLSYGARNHAYTNHSSMPMVLTDDEDVSNENDHHDQPDSRKQIYSERTLDTSPARPQQVQNGTFVQPRSPIHAKSSQRTAIAQMDTMHDSEQSAVSSNNHNDTVAAMGDDENTSFMSTIPNLPIFIQTRIQTENLDDATEQQQVAFINPTIETTLKSQTKFQKTKNKSTPEYMKTYKNATKKFKVKPRISYANRLKRSLYAMEKNETILQSSPTKNEVTSTNTISTPAHRTKRNAASDAINSKKLQQKSAKKRVTSRSPSQPRTRASTQRNAEKQTNEKPTTTQHRSRSLSKRKMNVNKTPQRRYSSSSSSSSSHDRNSDRSQITSQTPSQPCTRASSQKNAEQYTNEKPTTTQHRSRSLSKRKINVNNKTPGRRHSSSSSSSSSHDENSDLSQPLKALSTRAESRCESIEKEKKSQEGISRAHAICTLVQSSPPILECTPARATTRSPSLLRRIPSPQQKADQASTEEARDGATSAVLPKNNKRVRPKVQKTKNLKKPNKNLAKKSSPESPQRRSQRERKPTKVEPYAIEIYTRAYFPEKFKEIYKNKTKPIEKKTISNVSKKRESTGNHKNNLQPRVKLRRLNLNTQTTNGIDIMSNIMSDGRSVGETLETIEMGDIISWLQSSSINNTRASHCDTNTTLQYDGHFLSREFLFCENRQDIEFRFYGHQIDNQLGYIIFKPKTVKKMVTLKHENIRFVFMNGRFKFKIMPKNTKETKEYICTVGDAFLVYIGDRYGIENLNETENGHIMLIKEKQM